MHSSAAAHLLYRDSAVGERSALLIALVYLIPLRTNKARLPEQAVNPVSIAASIEVEFAHKSQVSAACIAVVIFLGIAGHQRCKKFIFQRTGKQLLVIGFGRDTGAGWQKFRFRTFHRREKRYF